MLWRTHGIASLGFYELNQGAIMANLMGKRYQCSTCEALVLVTKAGDGELVCHGQPMEVATTKPLPSSD